MKRIVNGVEVELQAVSGSVGVTEAGGRIVVRSGGQRRTALVRKDGKRTLVSFDGQTFTIERLESRARAHSAASTGRIVAPMPGLVVDVSVSSGDLVESGDKLLTLEAMKTQLSFSAPFAGKVVEVLAKGAQVQEGTLLVCVEELAP